MISPDINNLDKQELDRLFRTFSGLAICRYQVEYNPDGKSQFKIALQSPVLDEKKAIVDFSNLDTPELRHIVTAFKNPWLLEGKMAYFIDQNLVYKVENKQVTCDTLELAPYFQTPGGVDEIIKQSFNRFTGQFLYKDICKLEALATQINVGSSEYLLHTDKGQLVVSSKSRDTQILNSQGFTDHATKSDVMAMDDLANFAKGIIKVEAKPRPKL